MTDAFIYDHLRTPRGRGKSNGSLHEITSIDLATQVLRALRDRTALDTSLVDDVVLGCVTPIGEQGANIARVAVINADYATSVPGKQINRFCASGLEAVNSAAAQVMSGQADLCIGGGVESLSRVPMGSDGGAWAVDPRVAHKSRYIPQGISADLLATLYGISRDMVDRFAIESQRRAAHAWEHGFFQRSVVPVIDQLGFTVLDRDEHIRPGTTIEELAGLRPSFERPGEDFAYDNIALQRYPEIERIDHVHHAGNSSGIVDGAAATLIGTKEIGSALGLRPRARIVGFASIGTEPTIMLTGPAPAAEKVLKRCHMSAGDIDLFEVNEAFAAVVLRFMQALDVSHDKVNVNGGAIAIGHPLGASGTRISLTLINELNRRGGGVGAAALCGGGGQGDALLVRALG